MRVVVRHTSASMLFALGLPAKVIQESLGHRPIGVTMGIYAQILPSVHERTAAAFEAIISGDDLPSAKDGSK